MNKLFVFILVLILGVGAGPMGVAGPPNCADENGDTNGDKVRDLSDAVYALAFQFGGGPAPVLFCNPAGAGEDCASENGDTNGDKARDLSDAVYALAFQFGGGPAPVAICDAGGDCTDVDGDGVGNGDLGNTGCLTTTTDSNDGDANQCTDDDGDGCDDCSSGSYDPAGDGTDTDSDGICDVTDDCTDGDSDGVGNGNLGNTGCVTTTTDSDDGNPNQCADDNSDSCDDCRSGSYSTVTCGGTYADVQPIFQAKCTPCHQGMAPGICVAGGGVCFASFYEDTQGNSNSCAGKKVYECMLIRILNGSMPRGTSCTGDPAQDAGNDACLTAEQIVDVQAWVAGGGQE